MRGTEIALPAGLRAHGEVGRAGVVIAFMSVPSIAGGIVHGAVRRSLPQSTLMLLLGVLVVPVGLFGHPPGTARHRVDPDETGFAATGLGGLVVASLGFHRGRRRHVVRVLETEVRQSR